MSTKQAYPLDWPAGWRRTDYTFRIHDRFRERDLTRGSRVITIAEGVQRVLQELKHFGCPPEECLISTNVPVSRSGFPRSLQQDPEDSGVAVYFDDLGKPRCIACDRYLSVAGNLAAIAATLNAMRAIERHGGSEILNRAFSGFTALPPPMQVEQPWQVLGVGANASKQEVDDAYRLRASRHHPDRPDGDREEMTRINVARDLIYKDRGWT